MNQFSIGDLTIESEMRKLVDLVWQEERFDVSFSLGKLQPLGWEIFFFFKNCPQHISVKFDFEYNLNQGRERIKSEIHQKLSEILAAQD